MNEVIIVSLILSVAIVLFVTEWVRVDLVALMVMLGGGFRNPDGGGSNSGLQ